MSRQTAKERPVWWWLWWREHGGGGAESERDTFGFFGLIVALVILDHVVSGHKPHISSSDPNK